MTNPPPRFIPLDKPSNVLGTLFPAVTAVLGTVGFVTGDVERVYRRYGRWAIALVVFIVVAIALALFAAAINSEKTERAYRVNFWALLSAAVLFLSGTGGLVLFAVTSASQTDAPSVTVTQLASPPFGVEAEIKASSLPGDYSVQAEAIALQLVAATPAVPHPTRTMNVVLATATSGQDNSGTLDFKLDAALPATLLKAVKSATGTVTTMIDPTVVGICVLAQNVDSKGVGQGNRAVVSIDLQSATPSYWGQCANQHFETPNNGTPLRG